MFVELNMQILIGESSSGDMISMLFNWVKRARTQLSLSLSPLYGWIRYTWQITDNISINYIVIVAYVLSGTNSFIFRFYLAGEQKVLLMAFFKCIFPLASVRKCLLVFSIRFHLLESESHMDSIDSDEQNLRKEILAELS